MSHACENHASKGKTLLARLIRRSAFLIALVALATGVAVPAQTAAAADADAAYVMGYFKESLNGPGNVNAVHLAVSDDGLEWTPLNDNNAILTPTAGTKGIRDPFIYRLDNGTLGRAGDRHPCRRRTSAGPTRTSTSGPRRTW